MGIFFNYDRPGPGVDKNAPKKKGIFLYFELLFRNLGKLILANMLYFAVSLPVLLIYHILVINLLGNFISDNIESVIFVQLSAIITVLLAILWGTGPASCGYTYILRNTAREEHTFLVSDFFEKFKESFLHGIVFLIVDIIMMIIFSVAITTYYNLSKEMGGIYTILWCFALAMVAIYTIMHFYLYEMEVTFKDGILRLYKNSFLMTFATFPPCIAIMAVIVVLSYVFLHFLTPIAVVITSFVFWISVMRFTADLYTARVIKKNLLTKFENTEE